MTFLMLNCQEITANATVRHGRVPMDASVTTKVQQDPGNVHVPTMRPCWKCQSGKSEVSLGKIEDHLVNDTCPKSLRYIAWAKIRPDPDFKTNIKRTRKEAERKMELRFNLT